MENQGKGRMSVLPKVNQDVCKHRQEQDQALHSPKHLLSLQVHPSALIVLMLLIDLCGTRRHVCHAAYVVLLD